jgi:carbonic anhydrase
MTILHRVFALLIAFSLATGCERKEAKPTTALDDVVEDVPEDRLYALPGLKHGLLQSPVNILSGKAEGAEHQIALNLHDANPNYLSNTGDTIKLDFPEGPTVTFDGRTYNIKQVHFHTPSEHQIDGVTYPMELHVVSSFEPKTPDEPPCYLVFSFLYRMGEEDPFITSFLSQVPEEPGGEELEPGQVSIDDADRTRLIGDYYHYRGSLTTPPHTETVEWLIQKAIVEASPEQIRRINVLEGDNARRVQALYGRKVDE